VGTLKTWILPALVWIAGCGDPSEEPPPVAADQWPSPSDEEGIRYGRQMETAAKTDLETFRALIDWDVLLEKVTQGLGTEKIRRGFVRGAKKALRGNGGLAAMIVKAVAAGGSYRFLRIRERDRRKRAVFRLTDGDSGGFNYHEMILAKNPAGNVAAIDIYIHMAGETLSRNFRRNFLKMAAASGGLGRLSGIDRDYLAHLETLGKMTRDLRGGRHQEVLDAYATLPRSLREEKAAQIIRIQAAAEVDDKIYLAALDDFRRRYPDDAGIDIVSLDHYILNKRFDAALGCIDRIEKSVGGDIELNLARAQIYLGQGKPARARQATRAVIDQLPDMGDAYWTLVDVALLEKDHDETVRVLELLEQRFSMVFLDIETIPAYADFVRSARYRAWKKSRAK